MKLIIIDWLQKVLIKMGLFIKVKDALFSHPAEPLYRINKILTDAGKTELSIIDIGAADGMVSNYFSHQFPKAKIVGFEPNPAEFNKAINANKRNSNVEIRNLALSDSSGTQQMNILDNSFSSSLLEPEKTADLAMEQKLKVKHTLQVQTSTLDFELQAFKDIDLIKIDTQGTELNILKGGLDVLKRTSYILIEQNNNNYYKNGCQYYEVDDFLRTHKFELLDVIVSYRTKNKIKEFDAIYQKIK